MTLYYFKGIGADGAAQAGEMEAVSKEAAVANLLSQGVTPTFASDTPPNPSLTELVAILLGRDRLSPQALTAFTIELSALLEAQFPLDQALQTSLELAKGKVERKLIGDLLKQVRGGETFSAALERCRSSFPNFYISLVSAGEEAGDLAGSVTRAGKLLERAQETSDKIRSALIYPAFLSIMILATLVLVMTVVIPQFEPFFEDMGSEVPRATQIVLGVGSLVTGHWQLLLLGVIVLLGGLKWLFAQKGPRAFLDRFILTTPLLLGLPQKRDVGEFCESLGALLKSGVDIERAIAHASATVRNTALRRALRIACERIAQGRPLAGEFEATELFPDLAIKLITLGEKGGNLPEMLTRVATLYRGQVELAIDRLLSILVPLVTVLMGVIVAGFIGSILVGLMSVTNIG